MSDLKNIGLKENFGSSDPWSSARVDRINMSRCIVRSCKHRSRFAMPYDSFNPAHAAALGLILVGCIIGALFVTLKYEMLNSLLGLCAVLFLNV